MDNKLFTALEIAVIGGLILFVLYLGGMFTPAPTVTPKPAATLEPTPDSTNGPTRTPRPTRTPTPVTPTPTRPALTTPTGQIAFNSTRTGDTEVFLVNADGTELRNLTNHRAEDYVLEWSPDGTRLAFFSTRSNWLELYVVEIESGNIIQLTNTLASNTSYSYPISWSPDGEFIFSTRSNPWLTGGYMRSMDLDLIRTDGSGANTIFTLDEQYPYWNASLSPDGLYVAFMSQSDQGYGVHAARLAEDGLMAPRLVSQGCFNFTWMPRSHRLTCSDGGTLFNIDPDGGEKENVGGALQDYASSFGWSPDGQWMMGLYQIYGGAGAVSENTFAVIAPDKTRFEVVGDSTIETETAVSWSWSADSQWLAYTSGRFGPRDIFIVNIFDPNSLQQISANTIGENFSPRWRP